MKTSILFRIIFVLVITIVIASCSSSKSSVSGKADFKGVSDIYRGEKAVLKWEFPDAETVYIENLEATLQPKDSVYVYPTENTEYYFKVIEAEDTTDLIWRVFVEDNEGGIRTGPESIDFSELSPSYTNTDYFTGILSPELPKKPDKLKIIRTQKNENSQELELRAIVLDEFGNYLSGLLDTTSMYSFALKTGCTEENKSLSSFLEKSVVDFKKNIDIEIMIDNSLFAQNNGSLKESLLSFINLLDPNDNVSISTYNQYYNRIIDFNPAEKIHTALSEFSLKNEGSNALYRSGISAINNLITNNSPNEKILIVLNYGVDNSSVVYNANDLANKAAVNNIPIYIVGIGDALESYTLRYITKFSGGKYYPIFSDEQDQLLHVLREIMFSQKAFYEINASINFEEYECEELTSNLELSTLAGESIKGKESIILNDEPQYSGYQAICFFEPKSNEIPDQYRKIIRMLANLLKDNPGKQIELIGHSSIEGEDNFNNFVSLQRAQSVRRSLITLGVPPQDIRIRSLGSSKPIYYIQDEEWQQYFNRRVEIRWLDPSLLPFEILAESAESETAALEKVEKWENKGYQSYYERYLENNLPYYRVKIWGFPTVDAATTTVKAINQEYNLNFEVQ